MVLGGAKRRSQAKSGGCEKLLHSLGPGEAVLFLEAVHPTNAARPVGGSSAGRGHLAIEQTSGRQRLNVHGAIDLETGKTAMIDVETVDAASTIRLLETIEELYPLLAVIPVFLDNARCRHAQRVQAWLAQPGRRIRLHFVPAYGPHLNPIERLWGVMHKQLTHNTSYASYREFAEAVLDFLREHVPRTLARISSFGHRQLPPHRSERLSGSDVNGVYDSSALSTMLNMVYTVFL